MDLSTILTVVGAVVGQIVHVVKKRVEGGKEDELAAFKSQVLNKPIHTVGASIAAIAAAFQLVSPDTTELVVQFFTAFTAGLAANSVVNRSGK